jgi:hypothetical protein
LPECGLIISGAVSGINPNAVIIGIISDIIDILIRNAIGDCQGIEPAIGETVITDYAIDRAEIYVVLVNCGRGYKSEITKCDPIPLVKSGRVR